MNLIIASLNCKIECLDRRFDFWRGWITILYGHILRLTASNPNLREVEPLICKAARSLRILVGMSSNDCYELPLEHSGHVGRPRFGVSRAQLEYLLQNDFTGKQISEIVLKLGLSPGGYILKKYLWWLKAFQKLFTIKMFPTFRSQSRTSFRGSERKFLYKGTDISKTLIKIQDMCHFSC